jgi:hypothetical protein
MWHLAHMREISCRKANKKIRAISLLIINNRANAHTNVLCGRYFFFNKKFKL